MLDQIGLDIEREEYNCEINENMFERNKVETVLIKEKVKEL